MRTPPEKPLFRSVAQSRRPVIIAAIAIGLWLALAGAASPFAAKLSSLQKNNLADFLPGAAEATQVLKLEKGFQNASVVPAVVVFERPSGITAADRAAVAGEISTFPGLKGVVGRPSPPIASADGRALEVVVNVDATSITGTGDGVSSLRDAVRGTPSGLSAHVTGPAGLAADFGAAFKALDLKLLIGTTVVVIAVLLLVYRSPLLWAVPLAAVGLALVVAQALVYFIARYFGLSSNGQSQGLLTVLVFGAGTDYALLMISRYREELRRHAAPASAITAAIKGTAPAILASGTTVSLALICLLLSDLGSNKSLGPTAAIGIVCAMFAMLTVLPAVLLLTGRRLFWPFAPTFGSIERARPGTWARIAAMIGARSRVWWLASAIVLVAMAAGIVHLNPTGIASTAQYTVSVDSVTGQNIADRHFPAGTASPAVIIGNASQVDAIVAAARDVPGVADVAVLTGLDSTSPKVVDGRVLVNATLSSAADTLVARTTVANLRTVVHALPGSAAIVGGTTATDVDTEASSAKDRALIIPIVLAVIMVVLIVLLRSLVAPLLLIATVVLSYAATLGVSGLVFSDVFRFTGTDPSFPLTAFVFLTALGIDYNIFLMTRVREEALGSGTRRGVLTGLSSTGSVITSAGIVLAATFSVFGVLPLVIFAEIGFAVAFGVLLDTLVVRTVLVPALIHDAGARAWWPFRLRADSRNEDAAELDGVPSMEVA